MSSTTANFGLYKPDLSDTVNTTIPQLSSNFDKIDSSFTDLAQFFISAKASKYGAKGDGSTDDTSALQSAINDASSLGKWLYIPSGTYMVNALTSLNVPSNTKIVLSPSTTIKAITNSAGTYYIFNLTNVSNIYIEGGTITGDKQTHTGTTGEWGMGIYMVGSNNIKIKNTIINYCWGDGIYIGYTSNQNYCDTVLIEDVTCDNNRRNGISVVSGRNIKVIRPKLTNTNGTAPAAGIDCEPDTATELLEHIVIEDAYSNGNGGAGVLIALENMSSSSTPIDIEVNNHRDTGSQTGFEVAWGTPGLLGNISYNEGLVYNNSSNGILIHCCDYTGPRIDIQHPTVINPNSSGQTGGAYGAGILVYREGTETTQANQIGNTHIYNPVVEDKRATVLMTTGIFFKDYVSGAQAQNCSVIDPLVITPGIAGSTLLWFDVNAGVISDKYGVTTLDIGNTAQGVHASGYKALEHNASSTQANTVSLDALPVGWELTFEMRTANQMTVIPDSTSQIFPFGSAVGKGLYSTQKGARLTLKRINSTSWLVKEMIGTWTSQ